MFVKFTEKAQKALVMAESTAYHLCSGEVNTTHLLVALLKMRDLTFSKLLKLHHIDEKIILNHIGMDHHTSEVMYLEYSDELTCLLENAICLGRNKSVGVELLGMLVVEDGYESSLLLQSLGVDLVLLKKQLKEKKEHSLSQLPELLDLNMKVKQKEISIIGRDQELMMLVEILCRKDKNNAIIVGDAGVGKTALVEKLAGYLNEVDASHPLYHHRVYELDLPSVLAGTKYRGDFEEKLKKIIQALKEDRHAIVFIDEIHNLVDAGKAEGAIDASNILKPYLARGEITCIGATTYDEYKKYFESDPALSRRFAKIDLKEEKDEQIEFILKGLKSKYEVFHKIKIEDRFLKEMIDLSNRYLPHLHQPDKALDVLDLSCVKARMKHHSSICKEDMIEVVEGLCGFKLNQKELFEGLNEYLNDHLFGQTSAIDLFCLALKKRYREFIFLGPMGVGKTEMAKLVASYLNRHLIILNLSLKEQTLLEEIKRYPQSILLVDDAHLLPASFRQRLSQLPKQYQSLLLIYTSSHFTQANLGFFKSEKSGVYVIEFSPFSKSAALKLLNHYKLENEDDLNDCPYENQGAHALIRLVQQKQSEKAVKK